MPGSPPGTRIRADQLAVDLGLARSRAEAQALILAGAIHLDVDTGRRLSAGDRVDASVPLVRVRHLLRQLREQVQGGGRS